MLTAVVQPEDPQTARDTEDMLSLSPISLSRPYLAIVLTGCQALSYTWHIIPS